MNEGWVETTLGNLADWRGGMTPSLAEPSYWEGGTIPWASSKDVSGHVLTDTERHVTEAAVEGTSLRLAPPGSVVIVVRSGILAHTFPVAYVPFSTTVNQDIKVGVPKAEVYGEYLAYVLQSLQGVVLSMYTKTGTTVQSVNVPALMSHEVSVPPLSVQRRIVDLMAHLDNHIANLRTEYGVLQSVRSAALNDALRGYSSTDGWVETTLGDIANIQQGRTLAVKDMVGGAHPVFGANGIIGYFSEGSYDFSTVALGCRGSCGSVHLAPAGSYLANNVMGVWPRSEDVTSVEFLALLLEAADLVSTGVISGQVQPQITRSALSPLPVTMPPLPVQRRIVDRMAHLDSHIANLRAEYASLRSARADLLAGLLTGSVGIPVSYDHFLSEAA